MPNTNSKERMTRIFEILEKKSESCTEEAIRCIKNYSSDSTESMEEYAKMCTSVANLSDLYAKAYEVLLDYAENDIFFRGAAIDDEQLETVAGLVAQIMELKELRQKAKKAKKKQVTQNKKKANV